MIAIATAIKDVLDRLFTEPVNDIYYVHTHIGNPPVLEQYPAITIELMGSENTAIACRTFSQEHSLQITTWTDARTYSEAYQLRDTITSMIESQLFKTVYPLVKPYCWSRLAEPLSSGETIVKVDDSVFAYDYPTPLDIYIDTGITRYPMQFVNQVDDNTFQLGTGSPTYFGSGCEVIRPLVWVYDALLSSIENGTGNNGMLLHATMNYSLKIARNRYAEPWGI